jgi:hypothetical protein
MSNHIRVLLLSVLPIVLIGCGQSENVTQPPSNLPGEQRSTDQKQAKEPGIQNQQKLPDGEYPVQQASFDDSDGEYNILLLNAPSANFRTKELQMARLTDEQIKEGKKSYLKVENQTPVLYLTEDFKLEYTHNVVEERTNPTTGKTETVVVRQESNFWGPFAGSLAGNVAGAAIGNMLFRPQYYVPPQYQPGVPLSGYGGYGGNYRDAVGQYEQRYQQSPTVERNRTTFRANGASRSNSSTTIRNPQDMTTRDRSTGTGVGSSDLKSGDKSTKTESTPRKERSSGFGSGRSTRSGRRR